MQCSRDRISCMNVCALVFCDFVQLRYVLSLYLKVVSKQPYKNRSYIAFYPLPYDIYIEAYVH
jgi:hypothetical protein